MGNMHIDGFGMYIDPHNEVKIYRPLKNRIGDDIEEAFDIEKREIVKLLNTEEVDEYCKHADVH